MQLPPGYSIRIIPAERFTDYTVRLNYGSKEIGNVRVVEATSRCAGRSVRVHETHSLLDMKHRNKGLGLAMYAAAIEHGLSQGYTVVSSCGPSVWAQRVWRSKRLAEMYLVSKFARRWWVSRAKER